MAAFGVAVAQSRPSVAAIRDTSLPSRQARGAVCATNPAAMVYLDTLSLSRIGVSRHIDCQSEALVLQLGQGGYELSAEAESYMRLNTRSAAWGKASFATGLTRDVKWADCVDYQRLAPYMLGDGTGGDLALREYTFAGGYGAILGRWSVGAQASYRAEIAYRDRDPRLKTIVSNLVVKCGATYRVTPHYAIGLDAAIDIYRQDCDLDFYNPVNDINTYPLTGLGTYYKRFVGNANKSSGYQADGFSAGIQLINTDDEGFNASAEYARASMEQRLRAYNNLTLATTTHNTIEARLVYARQLSASVKLAPMARAILHTRRGKENLFGTAAGASYDIIGVRENYVESRRHASLAVPVEIAIGASRLTAMPQLSVENNRARVVDINRKYDVSGLTPALSIDYSLVTPRNLILDAGATIDYTLKSAPAGQNNIIQQVTAIDIEGLGECVAHNYDVLKSNRLATGVSAGIGKMHRNILFSIKVNYKYHTYATRHISRHYAAVTIGATF